MFKSVKTKLTLLFSISLLCLLLIFIVLLYFFISNAIEKNEQNQLYNFYSSNKSNFIYDLRNEKNKGLVTLEQDAEIFHFTFDKDNILYKGIESAPFHYYRLDKYEDLKQNATLNKMIEWNGYHFMLMKRPLQEN